MEQAFELLKQNGQNSVDNLVKWMQSCNIIDEGTVAEFRNLLKDSDQNNVELNEFVTALEKLASDHNKSMEDYTKQLEQQSGSITEAMEAGVSAIKDMFK